MKNFAADIIILYMCTKNHSHMMYSSWNIEWVRQFSVILGNFLPFQSPDNPENQRKKTPQDIIILHICTVNDNHMIYGSWDMEHNRQNFLSFRSFLPFYPPIDPENQNFEKKKKTPEDIIILQTSTINDSHMIYGSWDMESNGQNF